MNGVLCCEKSFSGVVFLLLLSVLLVVRPVRSLCPQDNSARLSVLVLHPLVTSVSIARFASQVWGSGMWHRRAPAPSLGRWRAGVARRCEAHGG